MKAKQENNAREIVLMVKALIITVILSFLIPQAYVQAQPEVQVQPRPEYELELVEPLEASTLPKIELATQIDVPAPKTTPAAPKVVVSGNKEDWLRQAGIPQSDWPHALEILNRESGFNPLARNKSSKAQGVCQALPASKMASKGSDYMTNPVTQLKWCHEYAQGYGGWAKAAAYSRCVGRCYSTKVNAWVNKDHKWW